MLLLPDPRPAFDRCWHPLLVADTVVTAQGKILRKAKDEADARAILATQSGCEVAILSCMIYKTPSLEVMDISLTHYFFAPFDPEEDVDALKVEWAKNKKGY